MLPLPGVQAPPEIGDALDRCYTPERLADRIVEAAMYDLRGVRATGHPLLFVEPSVGGGAFARAIRRKEPRALIVGIDVDPFATGGLDCDAVIVDDLEHVTPGRIAEVLGIPREALWIDAVLGNPPFSCALQHVGCLLDWPAGYVELLLPWAFWGVDEWQPRLRSTPPWVARPIPGRPWPDRLREAGTYAWGPRDPGEPWAPDVEARLRPLVGAWR
jgi:hypothetical protein